MALTLLSTLIPWEIRSQRGPWAGHLLADARGSRKSQLAGGQEDPSLSQPSLWRWASQGDALGRQMGVGSELQPCRAPAASPSLNRLALRVPFLTLLRLTSIVYLIFSLSHLTPQALVSLSVKWRQNSVYFCFGN
jgi:hypothetical protein